MAASIAGRFASNLRTVRWNVRPSSLSLLYKQYSDSPSDKKDVPGKKASIESTLTKFVKAVELWEEKPGEIEAEEEQPDDDRSFPTLLRDSKLFQLGDPSGRVVLGKIIEVQDNDLYIDFGGKFHCVCKRPHLRPHEYRRGTQVKLLLNDFEMSAAFLGSVKHVTLLEADATLIGLRRN
ncbi:Hypothetical predicted protein [Octopus vulgaris]|uniref:28S ribosomal protein S28, mitochondrial n=1 Tax=Octopus vulgaris TaxID=6645 RepID=A0AA36EYG7_OCTVU|nr:Hypothetical predicted protein [Octopus vulgaris]